MYVRAQLIAGFWYLYREGQASVEAVGIAATLRSWLPYGADKDTLNQIAHANDVEGSRYYNPDKNPYQGKEDHTKEAMREIERIRKARQDADAHIKSLCK